MAEISNKTAILKTMALAETLGLSFSAFEIWSFALKPLSFYETIKELDGFKKQGLIFEKDGYFCFPGQEKLVDKRLKSLSVGEDKLKKLKFWSEVLVRLPFVDGVFVSGSLALGGADEQSDLDVLVATSPGRIFSARFFVSWLTEMFGIRRRGKFIKNKICLNHFVSVNAFAFPFQNFISAFLWARIYPLVLKDKSLKQVFFKNRTWIRNHFPNFNCDWGLSLKDVAVGEVSPLKVGFVEKVLKFLEIRQIKRNPLSKTGRGRIVVNSDMLIFNPEFDEEQILQSWEDRWNKIEALA